jgi:hypothetical protein
VVVLGTALLSATAGAARDTTSLTFTVTAKGAPQPVQIPCQSPFWSNETQNCLRAGTAYRWTGTVRDGTAGIAGELTGHCTASGRANGTLGGGFAGLAGVTVTRIEQAQTVANCSFDLSFRNGSLSGTAVVTSLLDQGPKASRSIESIKISVTRGTGAYAGRTGRGSGKFGAEFAPATVTCQTLYAGCQTPVPLVIPAVDTQSEAWNLTLR